MKYTALLVTFGILLFSPFCHADAEDATTSIPEEVAPSSASVIIKFNSDEDLQKSIESFENKLDALESIKSTRHQGDQQASEKPVVTYEPKPVKINYQCETLSQGHVKVVLKHRALCVGDGVNTRLYPVAIGKKTTSTPAGQYKVINKREWPDWFPSEKIRHENPDKILPKRVPGGKENPLGARAIYLDHDGIRIHGTNRESSIGKAVSHGCIRMHNKHIEEVYQLVSVDSPVIIE